MCVNHLRDQLRTLPYIQKAVFSPALSPDLAVFIVKSLNPSNCLNMNSDALLGYTCSIPNGPDVTPIGIPPAGVIGMDTIAGVFTGVAVAAPGKRCTGTGRVSRGRVRCARRGGTPSARGVAPGDDILYTQ
jgi:hypothetical protein